MKLQNKVILITGAARGIGGTTAKVCAGYGAKIVAVDLNEELLKHTVSEIKEAGGEAIYGSHVTKRETVVDAVKRAVDTYGRIDALFNVQV